MKKFSKRERIILIVVVVVLLYGLYDVVLKKRIAPPERDTVSREQALRQTDELVSSMATAMKETEVSPDDAYAIELAGTGWTRDPFFTGIVTAAGVPVVSDMAEIGFLYTGYLEVGARRMAIINGIDYHTGESMDVPGYILRSVTPRQVVIVDQEGRQITVPFVEE
ncbi:MAG: general secretion pathway protein GspB [Syntrophales bacterium]|nr:general secretion pathway protein GspB [Syntrophales bacterium]MCK9528586.1 general secretion pathway protein GspB [Syntrophales bacterium]MDX9922777.1 hypothetical protein [Syntrophales bacterium]